MSAAHSDHISKLIDAVFRLNGALLQAGDALAMPAGISAAQWQVLGYLGQQEAFEERTTTAELARARGLRRQSVQETVNRLAAKGMLIRQPDPTDRRAPVLELTNKGRAALQLIEARRAGWVAELSDRLDCGRSDGKNINRALEQIEAIQAAVSATPTGDSDAPPPARAVGL